MLHKFFTIFACLVIFSFITSVTVVNIKASSQNAPSRSEPPHKPPSAPIWTDRHSQPGTKTNPTSPKEASALQTLEGVFTIEWGDAPDGTTQIIYHLTLVTGDSVQLYFSELQSLPFDELLALRGQWVSVGGDWIDPLDPLQGLAASQIQGLSSQAALAPTVLGSQPWVTVLCKFKDISTEPKPAIYFSDMYRGTYPGLDHYWREQSYNLMNVAGSQSTSHWYTLPQPRSYYVYDNNGDGQPDWDFDRASRDCTGVADAEIYYPNFIGINMMFNADLDGYAWGGGDYLTLDGVSRVWYATWEPPWGYEDITVIDHEMGHGFGLPHSSGEYGQTYDNQWDVLSDTWSNCGRATHTTYGCVGQHTVAYHKVKEGWINGDKLRIIPLYTSATVTLEQIALPQTANPLAIKVPIGSTGTFYTVEARRNTNSGYDVKLPGSAVIIHQVNESRPISAHVKDIDNNGNTGDDGAMWKAGEIYTDSTYNITIKVESATSSGFTVTVCNACNEPPILSTDDYGYTLNSSARPNWIDATNGVNIGLSGDDISSGPINIGFNFNFYENSYSQLYISTNGLISFGLGSTAYDNRQIPYPAAPGNFVTPFWDDLCVNYNGYNTGKIYTKNGGAAPNRFFVVEWYQVSRLGSTNKFTFEAILYENGNITFQYNDMAGDLSQATTGIEDDIAYTGLGTIGVADSNSAMIFTRPGAQARLKTWPLQQGRFFSPASIGSYTIYIRNTGGLGADTYEFNPVSTWNAALYNPATNLPLSDSDGDGHVDTGPVQQGLTVAVQVRLNAPNIAEVGDHNSITLGIVSDHTANQKRNLILNASIPAPFTQSYSDGANGDSSLLIVEPASQNLEKASIGHYPIQPVVSESPGGELVNVWSVARCTQNCQIYVQEIEYALLDRTGHVTRSASKLSDHSNASQDVYDIEPAAAVTPDGNIGITWRRIRYNPADGTTNHNLFLALLDSAGGLLYGPINLTNNNLWGIWSTLSIPEFYHLRIATTGDNRFMLAWTRESRENYGSGIDYLDDIYIAVRTSSGAEVLEPTKYAAGVLGSEWYYSPNLSTLDNNRLALVLDQWLSSTGDSIAYAILNSSGGTVQPRTAFNSPGYNPDVVQLSDGKLFFAWTNWNDERDNTSFTLLNADYSIASPPTPLENSTNLTGDSYVSVTADRGNHGILTWINSDYVYRRHLYYAMVDSAGSILTPPMIYQTALPDTYNIETSFQGYANTTRTINPTSNQVDTYITSTDTAAGAPGIPAYLTVHFGNNGTQIANQVRVQITLDQNLDYLGDNLGVIPTIHGNTITWNLPTSLKFMALGQFNLWLGMSSIPAGAGYPVMLTISSSGPEGNSIDNTANVTVVMTRPLYLPSIQH